ncbi:short chain dehydrogenase family protein [Lysobacter gummosus]|nr:short chain dehydrogenase family protein [Lysobacter gummosus]
MTADYAQVEHAPVPASLCAVKREMASMEVFIAGGSGAIGRCLVPMLVAQGHRVTAMTRSPDNASALRAMGADAVIADVFDAAKLIDVVTQVKPRIVIHQLTAFGETQADPLAQTIRVRGEGTRNLVEAARAAGAARLITQSISFVCSPRGTGLSDESTPLYLDAPEAVLPLVQAVEQMERLTLNTDGIEGVVLRYGWFYGPGTNYDPANSIPRSVRKGRAPIVGEGAGTYSFIHLRDAARATMQALTGAAPGIYNIVDDEPARLSEWLPVMAELLQAPPPAHLPVSDARRALGDMLVYIMNEQRGASNAKARRELGWEPEIRSWREGFKALYCSASP